MFDFDPNQLLRLSSLVPYSGNSPDGDSLPANDEEAKKKQNNSFTPSTVAQQRLNDLMQQMPEYQQPSLFTKIIAGMMGASSGPQTAMNYLNQPYQREMEGWKNQVGVAENAARDENTTNQIGRQLAYNQSQTQDREQKRQNDLAIAGQKASVAETRARTYQQNADTNKAKLDIMRASAQGHQIEFQKDGTAIIVHNDGTSVPVTGIDGTTPVLFTPQDMQQMKDDAAMARTQANVAGADARNQANNAVKGWTTFQDKDGDTYRLNQDTGDVQPVNLPKGAVKPSVASKPVEPQVSVTETQTPSSPFTHPIDWWEGKPQITKSTVTTREPADQINNPQSSIVKPAGNKVPNATDIPVNQRIEGKTQAMLNGKIYTWGRDPQGNLGWIIK